MSQISVTVTAETVSKEEKKVFGLTVLLGFSPWFFGCFWICSEESFPGGAKSVTVGPGEEEEDRWGCQVPLPPSRALS